MFNQILIIALVCGSIGAQMPNNQQFSGQQPQRAPINDQFGGPQQLSGQRSAPNPISPQAGGPLSGQQPVSSVDNQLGGRQPYNGQRSAPNSYSPQANNEAYYAGQQPTSPVANNGAPLTGHQSGSNGYAGMQDLNSQMIGQNVNFASQMMNMALNNARLAAQIPQQPYQPQQPSYPQREALASDYNGLQTRR